MNQSETLSITITLKRSDPAGNISQMLTHGPVRCACWVTCNKPFCYRHGCLNAIRKQNREVQS